MFRALLFDFDGVLANTEPIHFQMFQQVLTEQGILLRREEYYEKYLGLDDRSCFRAVYRDRGQRLTDKILVDLVRRKNQNLLRFVQGKSLLLPGVVETLAAFRGKFYLAIVSGALKNEIEAILTGAKLLDCFHLIIGAEQVAKGKPDPEGFTTAINWLNRDHVPEAEMLLPAECLAIEDSPWGIEAAIKAGVKCLAVTNSYPPEKLAHANRVIASLMEMDRALLESI